MHFLFSFILFKLCFTFIKIFFIKQKNKKKASPPREECRYQIEGVMGVKRRVDVMRADLVCIKEVTPSLEKCPLHP
ncbi:hypothetical protein Hanom_Chr04g00384091 [Helianthus anomalus]